MRYFVAMFAMLSIVHLAELSDPFVKMPMPATRCGAAESEHVKNDKTPLQKRTEAFRTLETLGSLHLGSGKAGGRLRAEGDYAGAAFEGRYDASVLREALPYLPGMERLQLELKPGQSLDAAEQIAQLAHLKALHIQQPDFKSDLFPEAAGRLSQNNPADITEEQMGKLGKLESLESLCVRNCRVTDAELVSLSKLRNLRILTLAHTNITSKSFQTIAKLPKIDEVAIYYQNLDQPIDEPTRRAVVSLNGRLRNLTFGQWGETRIHPSLVAAIAEIKSLTFLELGDISHMRPQDLEPLEKLDNLTHLEASASPDLPVAEAYRRLQQGATATAYEKAVKKR